MPIQYARHPRGAPGGPFRGRPVRPVAHGRARRRGARGRRGPRRRARDRPAVARRGPRALLDDLRPGRRDPRRPDRLPPGRGPVHGRRQRVQREGRVGRARGAARRVQGGARRPVARHRPRRDPGPAQHRHPPAAHRPRPRARSATTASPRARSPAIHAQVARTGYTGEDGFELFVDVEAGGRGLGPRPRGRPRRTGSCRSASAPATRSGSRPGCRSTATSWTATTNPYQAGLGRVVKLGKAGDFVGPDGAREGRQGRRRPPARRPRAAGAGDRPPRLPGARHGRRRPAS